jgi:hypothetical protein
MTPFAFPFVHRYPPPPLPHAHHCHHHRHHHQQQHESTPLVLVDDHHDRHYWYHNYRNATLTYDFTVFLTAFVDRCWHVQAIVSGGVSCVGTCSSVGGYTQTAPAGYLACTDCPQRCNAAVSPVGCCTDEPACGFLGGADGNCTRCNSVCSGCTGPNATLGAGGCTACVYANHNNSCVSQCPALHFLSSTTPVTCTPCSSECHASGGCVGPAPSQCDRCSGIRLANGDCAQACTNGTIQVPEFPTSVFDLASPAARAHCVPCGDVLAYTAPNGTCQRCSSQCDTNATCIGPGPGKLAHLQVVTTPSLPSSSPLLPLSPVSPPPSHHH